MKAVLVLEDGTIFEGTSIGAEGTVVGEVVFHTAMTGYQEILTDPACYGQIVAMTYPLIGNCGYIDEERNSEKPLLRGFIVREICDSPNNWRTAGKLNDYLVKNGTTGIEGIDTRALTRLLREKGTMNGIISTESDFNPKSWLETLHDYKVTNPARERKGQKTIHYEGDGPRVVMVDLGDARQILDSLQKRDCEAYVVPYHSSVDEILGLKPDGIVFSNGAGDPKDDAEIVATVKELLANKPVLGIGLGHQLVALACGAQAAKLKYGHRGGNQPVKDLKTGVTHITSQNHGYVVAEEGLDRTGLVVSLVNMNDGTIEGLRHSSLPALTVQFHPDGRGPSKDTGYLYDGFIHMMDSFSRRGAM
jgi:carbamoyl-phosphate synthase small subunit